jgi:hypothetical protein
LNLRRTARVTPVVGVLLPTLLLFGCGHTKATSAPSGGNSATTPVNTQAGASPPTEGTGPEPTLPRSSGVSVSVAGLPIGVVGETAGPSGNDACLTVHYFGQLVSGVVLAVSRVVVSAPLRSLGADTTGCPSEHSTQPRPCVGDELNASDNGDAVCYARVAWSGDPPSQGALELTGVLRCSNLDNSSCQQVASSVSAQQNGPTSFDLTNLSPAGTNPTTSTSTSTSLPPANTSTPGATRGTSPSGIGSP